MGWKWHVFYEEEDLAYCTYMIYGSGVRVGDHHTSKVVMNSENELMIQLPTRYLNGFMSDAEEEDKVVDVVLSIKDNIIILGDLEFEVDPNGENYKYINEFDNK